MSQRHFLFLQGLPGPSLRLIAKRLAAEGHRVTRVNLNGGDWLDWRGGGTNFRGTLGQWPAWLGALCHRERVSDLVLFGETRPAHIAAAEVAAELGLDLHVLEEGYLRPNSVTLEYWPRGAGWEPPASLEECRARIAAHGVAGEEVPQRNYFRRRMAEAIAYWLATAVLRPVWPHYRSHRHLGWWREATGWIGRWLRRPLAMRRSAAALARLEARRFFLLPLQLDGDAQIRYRSPYDNFLEAVDLVTADFAAHAPADTLLLVKRHPLDPDIEDWRAIVTACAARHGASERVLYIEYGDLDALLPRAEGVVTVNSTVGSLALREGKPVHILGTAIYGLDGLVDRRPLQAFWSAPQPPAPDGYATFAAALRAECLINAGFHSAPGLERLAKGAARRILARSSDCSGRAP